MGSVATRFFAVGAVAALCGMVWGIQMAATQDHLLSPAHGHLNLIGFVVMSVFGAYYALTPAAAASRMAQAHFWLMLAAVVVIVPGIALAIRGVTEAMAIGGSFLALAGMALFLWVVLRFGVGPARAGGRTLRMQAAE